MKSFWLLLPALAVCIRAKDTDRNFTASCSELELDPNRGFLNAFCPSLGSDKADHGSQVDLNGCLAWGLSNDTERTAYMENELYPAEGGNFSQFCNSCHIIREGESTQVGHIICNCAPKGSDVVLEYMYDLKKIVEIDDSGCLRCGNAPRVCTRVKKDEYGDLLEGESIPPAAVPGLIDGEIISLGPQNKMDISDCDGYVSTALEKYPAAIPKTYRGLPIRPCEPHQGLGLCCFFPVEGEGNATRGFHFIEDPRYVYRVEYQRSGEEFSKLYMVWRYCKYPDKCPGGNPDNNAGPTMSKSMTSSTQPPFVSTHPNLAASLEKKGIQTSTASRNVTGIPDIYFPTPSLTGRSPSSPGVTSAGVSPKSSSPALKIDLGKLDAPGLVDIMLDATNIEEAGSAQLKLSVKTNCFKYADGKLNCKEVVVEFTGHKIDGRCVGKGCPKSKTKPVNIREAIPTPPAEYDFNKIKTKTITATTTEMNYITVSTRTTVTTVSTHKTVNNTALPTDLLMRLPISLRPASERTAQPPRFRDTAQAVLGPRSVPSTEVIPGLDFTTVGYKSKITSKTTDNLTPTTSIVVPSTSATGKYHEPGH